MEVLVISKHSGVTMIEQALSLKDADDMIKWYKQRENNHYIVRVICDELTGLRLPCIFTRVKAKNDKVIYELAV